MEWGLFLTLPQQPLNPVCVHLCVFVSMYQSNEDATAQMSVVIKRAAKELIAANKLISYREKEVGRSLSFHIHH